MNKTSSYLIRNLWWLVPVTIIMLFWQHSSPILILLVFAYLGRIILNPVVCTVEKWIGSRRIAVFIIMAILIILLIILSTSTIPILKNQISIFQEAISMESINKFQSKLTLILQSFLPVFLFDILSDTLDNFDASISEVWSSSLSHINSFIGSAGSVAFALGSALLSFVILIVFMIFFLLEGEFFSYTFLHSIPGENYGLAKRMMGKTSTQIHSYIRGQLLAGTSVAITSIIGLYMLQWITGISIPHTFLVGIVAGLFNLIPFIGPIMGMIPAIIIYLVTEQTVSIHIIYVLLIIGVFAIVQLIDNLVMSPYIMGSSVGLHPMLVIILVLLGASVAGILGMLFAVPMAAILKVIIEELNAAFNKH